MATAASRGLSSHQLPVEYAVPESVRIAFLRVDEVRYLEVEGEIGLDVHRIHSILCGVRSAVTRLDRFDARSLHTYVPLQWGLRRLSEAPKTISGRVARRSGLHGGLMTWVMTKLVL